MVKPNKFRSIRIYHETPISEVAEKMRSLARGAGNLILKLENDARKLIIIEVFAATSEGNQSSADNVNFKNGLLAIQKSFGLFAHDLEIKDEVSKLIFEGVHG